MEQDVTGRSEAGQLVFQELATEVSQLTGVMSCTIIDDHGDVKGHVPGEIPHRQDIMERAGTVAAVIWGGVSIGESEAGALTSVVVSYSTFRVIGVPISGMKVAVLVTAALYADLTSLINTIAHLGAMAEKDLAA